MREGIAMCILSKNANIMAIAFIFLIMESMQTKTKMVKYGERAIQRKGK